MREDEKRSGYKMIEEKRLQEEKRSGYKMGEVKYILYIDTIIALSGCYYMYNVQ